ncbi:MAG TPA: hypothetical protein VK480_09725 [Solirubrobacterales bacterium]|nr:hypothetical protein [Solirubrobacterales bacterium]
MHKKFLALFLVLAIGALAIGCGGGDDTSSSPDALTKAAYVKQANAICTQINEEIASKFTLFSSKLKRAHKGASVNVAKAYFEEVENVAIPALEEQIEKLSALPAPAGDEEAVKLVLERQEESLQKTEENPRFRIADAPGTAPNPYQRLNKPAQDYGLTECAV